MAKQFGFFVIEMSAQFGGTTVTEEQLLAVRNGLAFTDLYRGTGPSLPVRDRLRDHLGPYLPQFADTWTQIALDPDIPDMLSRLRNRLSRTDRSILMNELRSANRTLGNQGGW
jgi:hypothetical protein